MSFIYLFIVRFSPKIRAKIREIARKNIIFNQEVTRHRRRAEAAKVPDPRHIMSA